MTVESADRRKDDDLRPVSYTVLSHRTIVWAAAVIVIIAVGMAVWMLVAYGGNDDRAQLEAIKTAGTVVIGTGGAAALLLAARRQRSTEIALKHQERVAAATESDAAERRITELYTKAADQLGAEKAPVRLAGLYALERLAQNTERQRQTIVNVLCAYLRMPYTAPYRPALYLTTQRYPLLRAYLREFARQRRSAARGDAEQEREVRLTAQRILASHLRPVADPSMSVDTFWPDVTIDLNGATLVDFDFSNCHVQAVDFSRAQFVGNALFEAAQFGAARFEWVRFQEDAKFRLAQFHGNADFNGSCFDRLADFDDATFEDRAWFLHATFDGHRRFRRARFAVDVEQDGIRSIDSAIARDAIFKGATFGGKEDQIRLHAIREYQSAQIATGQRGTTRYEAVD